MASTLTRLPEILMSETNTMQVASAERAATSLVATVSLGAGMGVWLFSWWNAYAPMEGLSVSSQDSFFLFLMGLGLVVFGNNRVERAGETVMQLATVLLMGAMGVGVWGLAMLAPDAWFARPISANLGFCAFLMGAVALRMAAKAAETMARET